MSYSARRLLRLLLGLALVLGGSAVQSAPPTEWVARGVSYAQCSQGSGTTNTSSSGSGTDFAHSLTCAVDANTITTGTMVRACAHVTATTGSAAPLLQFKLKAGSTTLYAPAAAAAMANSVTRTSAFCFVTIGAAVPSASSATYTSIEGFPTELFYTDQSNVTTQPTNLNTTGQLVWTFVSQWASAGTGTNSLVLNSFTVTIAK